MYLSSFRLGARPDHLARLTRTKKPFAIIGNAIDHEPPHVRQAKVAEERAALSTLGIDAEELDLRHYIAKATDLANHLSAYEGLWVRGGNVFVLRRAMGDSGFDAAVRPKLRAGGLIYAGYSAGPAVLGPTLRGLDLCDDPALVTETYGSTPTYDGLNVLPYLVIPHVNSPSHPESPLMAKVCEQLTDRGVRFRPLSDGQALVINGAHTHVVG